MRSASDYGAYVRGLLVDLVREGILRRQVLPLELHIGPDGRSGYLFTAGPGLLYNDGAVLKVEEAFRLDAVGDVQRQRYAYQYERLGGYYFRFERESHDGDLVYKPECHLHVLWRLPHFPTASQGLKEILDLIRVNFYGSHRQRLVGQSIAVIV